MGISKILCSSLPFFIHITFLLTGYHSNDVIKIVSFAFNHNFSGLRPCNNLERLVNNHRKDNNLSPISCHDKPRYLAERHVYDLREANSNCRGDLHEWKSSKYTGKYSCSNMHYFLWFYIIQSNFLPS